MTTTTTQPDTAREANGRLKFYVAGCIGNDPNYQWKFELAGAEVIALGHEPVLPTEIHDGCCVSWEDYMRHDLKALLDCDGVYALRDWKRSKGATIEIQLALRLRKTVIYQSDVDLTKERMR